MSTAFESLAEGARASFAPQHCRLIALLEHGDAGYALFDTRPSGEPYLYEVHYDRQNGRWSEGSSSNGPGWHLLDRDADLGILTTWGPAPPDADSARIEFDGKVSEAPVSNGIYLAVWWDVPCPTTDAHPTAFRVRGEWVAPTWRERLGL